jgi:hypothetical protein
MSQLFQAIAKRRSATEQDVRESLNRRPIGFDLAVILSFALILAFALSRITQAVIRTHLQNNAWLVTLLMLTFLSLAAGVTALMVGAQWGTIAEGLRLGTGHLSYRSDRIPWNRHPFIVFWAGTLLAGAIGVVQCRRDPTSRQSHFPASVE